MIQKGSQGGSAEIDKIMSGLIRERKGKRMEENIEQEKRKKRLQI